jgi:hypothetical protein
VRRLKKQTEKLLEKKIIFSLKLQGFYVHKTASHPGVYDYNLQYNEAGIADLIVLGGPNRVTFLEVKTPKGRQSVEQKVFEEICAKHKVKYAVVRSVGEAIKQLNNKQEVKNGTKRN